MSDKISLKPLVRNSTYERWRWQIFLVTWIGYAGLYLTRKSFPVAKVGIDADPTIDLSVEAMAWIDLSYLAAYAAGQFFWGIMADKIGTRKVILGGLLMSVIACVGMGLSHVAVGIGFFSLIQGMCQSTGWAPLTKNVSSFFSTRERGTIMGIWCTNYAVGGVAATLLAGWAGEYWGWEYAFYVPAGVLFLIFLMFVFFQKNKPEDAGLPSIEEYHGEVEAVLLEGETPDEEPEGSWKVIFEVITSPMIMLLATVYFFLKPTRYAILFWGPLYMNEMLGTGTFKSGALSILFELAGPISVLLGGVISDRVFGSRRMPVCVISLFALAVVLFGMSYLPTNQFYLGGSFFLIGLLLYAPDSLISGTAAVDFGTKKGASTAAGMINGFGSIGAAIGGTVPGFFKDKWGWDGVFIFLGCTIATAAVLLVFQWNKLPIVAKSSNVINS